MLISFLILQLFIMILMFCCGYIWKEENYKNRFQCIGLVLLVSSFTIIGAYFAPYNKGVSVGYRTGQIEALSKSRIKYELILNKDGSKTWEEIKDKSEE